MFRWQKDVPLYAGVPAPDDGASAGGSHARVRTLSERKGWTQEALACNILATSWPQIQDKAAELAAGGPPQAEMGV